MIFPHIFKEIKPNKSRDIHILSPPDLKLRLLYTFSFTSLLALVIATGYLCNILAGLFNTAVIFPV